MSATRSSFSFGASIVLHAILLLLLATVRIRLAPNSAMQQHPAVHLVAPPRPARFSPAPQIRAPLPPPQPAPLLLVFHPPARSVAAVARPTPVLRADAPQLPVLVPALLAPPALSYPEPPVRTGVFSEIALPKPMASKPAPAVQTGGFAAATLDLPTRSLPRVVEPALKPASPVEIVSKPQPQYTEEARQRRIEGNVLLEILFAASGEVRVLSIIRALGYGLDQSAIDAARRIRFRPAQRDGQVVDSRASVQIEFRLAY